MKSLTAIMTALMLGINLTACSINTNGDFGSNKRITANKNYVTKEYKVSDFNKIKLTGSGNVFFTQQAGAPAVSVVTSDNVAEILDVYVENNTLYLKIKKGYSVKNLNKLDYTINAAALNEMGIVGSGDFKLMNGLTTDQLNLSISGSGDMDCNNINCTGQMKVSITGSGDIDSKNVQCNDLRISISGSGDIGIEDINAQDVDASIAGSGDIRLSGKTAKASYGISGSGDIEAVELKAEDVSARTTGSGDITCFATQSIKASRSGSGGIGYKGNPANVDVSKKGVYPIE